LQKNWKVWETKNKKYIEWYEGNHPTVFSILWQILGQKTLELTPPVTSPDEVMLDVGCGEGRYLLPTTQKGYLSIGLDPNSKVSLKMAKKKMEDANLDSFLVKAVGEYIPLQSSKISLVMCNSMLDHTLKPEVVIDEMRRVLKKDGFLVLWQGIYNKPQQEHETAEQETHLRSFTKIELIQMFEKAGFSLCRKEFLGLDSVSSSDSNKTFFLKVPNGLNRSFIVLVKFYLLMGKMLPQHAAIAMLKFKKV
jgi:ubiquinone/menaquinone biosynthesis C-methylase UbiE